MRVYAIQRKTDGKIIFTTPTKSMVLHRLMKLDNKEDFKLAFIERR